MRIVVNHLTRMRGGTICIAGIDVETRRHVRPVLGCGQLMPDLLARNNGPFGIGNIVDLGFARHIPKQPHVEDFLFNAARARCVDGLAAENLWALLCSVSKARLREIFGKELRASRPSSCVTDAGKGKASLGCLRPIRMPRLYYFAEARSGRPRIRIRIQDGQFDAYVSVTDVRLYEDDCTTPDRAVVDRIRRRLERPHAVILAVGLTRQYAPSTDAAPVHWLQVNNIHLQTDPLW